MGQFNVLRLRGEMFESVGCGICLETSFLFLVAMPFAPSRLDLSRGPGLIILASQHLDTETPMRETESTVWICLVLRIKWKAHEELRHKGMGFLVLRFAIGLEAIAIKGISMHNHNEYLCNLARALDPEMKQHDATVSARRNTE